MTTQSDFHKELRHYAAGFCLALVLTLAAFGLVVWHPFGWATNLTLIGVLALVQIIVHFYFFLHIDLSRQKREDLQLILFSVLLLIIMAGGTIWIIANLATRMHSM